MPLNRSLAISGYGALSDPDQDYLGEFGPTLRLAVDFASDPLASLEPQTEYEVTLSADLADRAGAPILLDAPALARLRFTTEPLLLVQAGIGDPDTDPSVRGQGGPFVGPRLANDGVVVLRFNAPVDVSNLSQLTATVDDQAVPVKFGVYVLNSQGGKPVCDPTDQHTLYVFSSNADHMFRPNGQQGALKLQIRGGQLRDLSQATGHPPGSHTIATDIVFSAPLLGAPASSSYTGLLGAEVSAAADCPK